MVTYLPRSAWAARAARGSTALVPSVVVGEALHWPGMAEPIDAAGDIGMRRVASALRGWQNYHMDGRGWSDIAYQIAIDQAGRAWTLRGINIRSGANGDATVNKLYGAFLLILAPGEKPSAAMVATTKAVIADFRKRFPKARAKPYGHRDVRAEGTDCPGPLAYAAIQAGTFTPGAAQPPTGGTPTKPPVQEDDMQLSELVTYNRGLYGDKGTEGVWNKALHAKLDLLITGLAATKLALAKIDADDAEDDAQHRETLAALAKINETLAEAPAPEPAPKA